MSGFEIKTLDKDAKITEPGFYAIPIERHHHQPCDGPSVTSSVLRTMENRTPADVWAFHDLNPDRMTKKETPALRMGRAMALFIEGGQDALETGFRVLDADKPKRPTEAQKQAYLEGRASDTAIRSIIYWREVEEDPRDIITDAEFTLIMEMGKVLAKDPPSCAALGGIPEITMAWRDEITGIWCLARPDQVAFSGMLSDYKKINTQGRAFNGSLVDQRITQHGYDMQMAFAAHGFEILTGHWPGEVGLVCQWDEPPYHPILRAIDEEDLRIAAFRNDQALRRFKECLDSGNWPGPGEHVGSYRRPDWQREWLLERMQTAGTAP